MKFRFLATLILGFVAAQPAAAQTDRLDSGDWWWLDARGDGVAGEGVFLANGEARRRGDKSELDIFLIFRKPDARGAIGIRVREVVNCAAKTRADGLVAVIFPNGKIVELEDQGFAERGAVDTNTAIYAFACTDDRRATPHFGDVSRRKLSDTLFAKPAPR